MPNYPAEIYVRSQDANGNFTGFVKAKYLTDASGNYVINPSAEKFNTFVSDGAGNFVSYLTANQQLGTSTPYIVPFDYSPTQTINTFSNALSNLGTVGAYQLLFQSYSRGGGNDIQRSYNGQVNTDFVLAFKPIASFDFGLGCTAAGLSVLDCLNAGGIYNQISAVTNWAINTSGYAGNNPDNVSSIIAGAAALENHRLTAPVVTNTTSIWQPSMAPLTYTNPQTVLISQGDTLWKIWQDQNAQNNPISINDLMQANGLLPGQELQLQIGQRIIVPSRDGNNLLVNYGDVQLNMSTVDDTYRYTVNNTETNTTTIYSRIRDGSSPFFAVNSIQ